ncbi:MAG: hypothetical protein AAGA75_01785 [Cyanobacteria bacterium P01_E01_bin.6]
MGKKRKSGGLSLPFRYSFLDEPRQPYPWLVAPQQSQRPFQAASAEVSQTQTESNFNPHNPIQLITIQHMLIRPNTFQCKSFHHVLEWRIFSTA